jgi:hypothetical protein
MFSERSSMAIAAERWCDQIGVSPVAFNVVTALFRLGLVQKPHPTLTNEEREAIIHGQEALEYVGADPHCPCFETRTLQWAATLRGLLERTTPEMNGGEQRSMTP